MKIHFTALAKSHFLLLLKWLEKPHVKRWWDQDIQWTSALIQKKFGSYVKGYKLEKGKAKKIKAYIVCVDEIPIGYIQLYNAYDFPRSKPLQGLPESLAAFDIFIGEENYIGSGIGSKIIALFLNEYAAAYKYVFVDPDSFNHAAIRAYEKTGFKKISEQTDTDEIGMLKNQTMLDTTQLSIEEVAMKVAEWIKKS
jgi:RimJ/RimL family protein N-acetyltransferase